MATDIRQSILDELARQGRSRYWLLHQTDLSANTVYGFLRGDGGGRQDAIEQMLDALDLRLVPGELADRVGAGKGAGKGKRASKGAGASKGKSKRTSKGTRRRKADK